MRRVIFEETNRLSDLSGLADAPNLSDVVVSDADALLPEAFDPIVANPSVGKILPGIALTNTRRWQAVLDRIPAHRLMEGFYGTENETFELVANPS